MQIRLTALALVTITLVACAQFDVSEKIWMHPGYAVMAPKAIRGLEGMPGYDAESVYFDGSDGTRLHGLLLTKAGNKITVLYFGGDSFQTGESGLEIGQLFEALDVNALLVDYRGYGGSDGQPTLTALNSDALVAYDYIQTYPKTAGTAIVVHGFSLGSVIAPYVAANRPVNGLVLESTVTDVSDWAENAVPWYFRPFVRIKIDKGVQQISNVDMLKKYHGPLNLLVGGDDSITPERFSETLYRQSPTPQDLKALYVAPGFGHGEVFEDLGARKEYAHFIEACVLQKAMRGNTRGN